jgi:hypothetical protein
MYLVMATPYKVTCGNKGGGHTELSRMFKHYVVVSGGVEGALEVRVRDADVFVVDFDVLQGQVKGGARQPYRKS